MLQRTLTEGEGDMKTFKKWLGKIGKVVLGLACVGAIGIAFAAGTPTYTKQIAAYAVSSQACYLESAILDGSVGTGTISVYDTNSTTATAAANLKLQIPVGQVSASSVTPVAGLLPGQRLFTDLRFKVGIVVSSDGNTQTVTWSTRPLVP
jgi:hypothetical protein